jgi:hypothetical protein
MQITNRTTSWRGVVTFAPPAALLPWNEPPRSIGQEVGWAQSRSGRYGEVKIVAPTELDYTDCAIPALIIRIVQV